MGQPADNGVAFVVLEQTGPSRWSGQLLFMCHNHGGGGRDCKPRHGAAVDEHADRVRACWQWWRPLMANRSCRTRREQTMAAPSLTALIAVIHLKSHTRDFRTGTVAGPPFARPLRR